MQTQQAGELGLEGGGAGTRKASRKRRGKNGHDHGADVAGRKDQSGQEAVIDKTALVKGMPKGIKMVRDLADMTTDVNVFFKNLAEKTGLNAGTLRAAAKAYAGDKEEEAKRKADQTSLIFTECAGTSGAGE